MKHESDGDTNCSRCDWYNQQRIGTTTGGLENKRISENHPNYSILNIGRNTEKCLKET